MGHSEAQIDLPALLDYIATSLPPTLSRIIQESYPLAQEWNDLYYGTKKEKATLVNLCRFGMLNEEHLVAMGEVAKKWTEGNDGDQVRSSFLCPPLFLPRSKEYF
jgi:hypothetical protein